VRSTAPWLAVLLAVVSGYGTGPAIAASPTGPGASAVAFGLDELTTLLKREGSATASYSELQYRKVLKEPIRREGELRFTPPATFEKRVLAPVTETYRIEGETLSMELPGRKTRQVSLRNQPLLGGLLLGFKAVVSGQIDTLTGEFATTVTGSAESWRLDLAPARPEVAKYIETISVTGRMTEPLRFEVIERNGDRTVTDIAPR